jgi:hypothetical protein
LTSEAPIHRASADSGALQTTRFEAQRLQSPTSVPANAPRMVTMHLAEERAAEAPDVVIDRAMHELARVLPTGEPSHFTGSRDERARWFQIADSFVEVLRDKLLAASLVVDAIGEPTARRQARSALIDRCVRFRDVIRSNAWTAVSEIKILDIMLSHGLVHGRTRKHAIEWVVETAYFHLKDSKPQHFPENTELRRIEIDRFLSNALGAIAGLATADDRLECVSDVAERLIRIAQEPDADVAAFDRQLFEASPDPNFRARVVELLWNFRSDDWSEFIASLSLVYCSGKPNLNFPLPAPIAHLRDELIGRMEAPNPRESSTVLGCEYDQAKSLLVQVRAELASESIKPHCPAWLANAWALARCIPDDDAHRRESILARVGDECLNAFDGCWLHHECLQTFDDLIDHVSEDARTRLLKERIEITTRMLRQAWDDNPFLEDVQTEQLIWLSRQLHVVRTDSTHEAINFIDRLASRIALSQDERAALIQFVAEAKVMHARDVRHRPDDDFNSPDSGY